MAENNPHPCPFMQRCAHADENCSEEKSANCDVLTYTKPTAPPEWKPAELVAVTMNREQWREISNWLEYCIDWYHCRMVWWRDCCDDKRVGAVVAAQHEASIRKCEILLQIIEEATHGESKSQ